MTATSRRFAADRGDAGRRLDLVLRRHLTDVRLASRTRVQEWIENGLVSINDRAVRRVATRVAFGDDVAVALPARADEPRREMAAENLSLAVLHEDDYLLAIDKPAGMVVHPTAKHLAGTMMNALLWHARGWPAPLRPSLVGRLDKLTSGIVIVAKSAVAHAALQRAMSSKSAVKDYLAVVYGRVKAPRGDIDLRLGRDPGDRRRVVASLTTGTPSLTRFERLARGPGVSLLRCRLVTGRTHQIRVHLAASGWPIVGDLTYGEPRWPAIADSALAAEVCAFPRQALHAWRVAFVHPATRQRLMLEAPVPTDFAALMDAAGLRTGSLRGKAHQLATSAELPP